MAEGFPDVALVLRDTAGVTNYSPFRKTSISCSIRSKILALSSSAGELTVVSAVWEELSLSPDSLIVSTIEVDSFGWSLP